MDYAQFDVVQFCVIALSPSLSFCVTLFLPLSLLCLLLFFSIPPSIQVPSR